MEVSLHLNTGSEQNKAHKHTHTHHFCSLNALDMVLFPLVSVGLCSNPVNSGVLKMKKLRHKIVKESLLAQSALVISYLPLIIKGSYPGVWFRARYPGLHRDRCLLPQLLLATQSYLAESSLPNTYESMRYLKKHILPSIHLSTSSSSPPYSSDNCLSQWGT
jgi:hypothetical protein